MKRARSNRSPRAGVVLLLVVALAVGAVAAADWLGPCRAVFAANCDDGNAGSSSSLQPKLLGACKDRRESRFSLPGLVEHMIDLGLGSPGLSIVRLGGFRPEHIDIRVLENRIYTTRLIYPASTSSDQCTHASVTGMPGLTTTVGTLDRATSEAMVGAIRKAAEQFRNADFALFDADWFELRFADDQCAEFDVAAPEAVWASLLELIRVMEQHGQLTTPDDLATIESALHALTETLGGP